MIVAAPVFGLDGKVRRLLNFQDQTAGADGVDDTGVDKEYITGLDRDPVDEFGHGFLVGLAAFHGIGEFFGGHLTAEAKVDAGIGTGGEDQPGFRLAVGAAEVFSGEFPGGVDLHGKTDGAVQILDQHPQIFSVTQIFLRILGQQFVEGLSVLPAQGDALQRVGVARVQGPDTGADPFLRLAAIFGGIPQKVVKQLAAQVDTKNAAAAEKDRVQPGSVGFGHKNTSCMYGYSSENRELLGYNVIIQYQK